MYDELYSVIRGHFEDSGSDSTQVTSKPLENEDSDDDFNSGRIEDDKEMDSV